MEARTSRTASWLLGGWLLVQALAAPAALVPFENVSGRYRTMTVDGQARSALVLAPRHAPDDGTLVPLLIVLHYLDGEPEAMANFTLPGAIVRDAGAYAILPEALKGAWTLNPQNRVGPDDVGFLTALIDDAIARYPIDPRRVYIAGFSNGAYMAQRYACEHPEKIAGLGVAAATMRKAEDRACTSTTPVPVIQFNGTEDGVARYDGQPTPISNFALSNDNLSATAAAERWARVNGCALSPRTEALPDRIDDGTTVSVAHYDDCTSGFPVDFYTVQGGGHTWPGALDSLPALGVTTQDVNATQAMWTFFQRFARP